MAFHNMGLQKMGSLTTSQVVGKILKKEWTAGITDHAAEETGKDAAMNCWNLLLQEISSANTAGSTEDQTLWKSGPGLDLSPLG